MAGPEHDAGGQVPARARWTPIISIAPAPMHATADEARSGPTPTQEGAGASGGGDVGQAWPAKDWPR